MGPVDRRCGAGVGRDDKACGGKIEAEFESGTGAISWECPACGDRGSISNWQETPWDRGGRKDLPDIRRITYRRGLVAGPKELGSLKTTVLEGPTLTLAVIVAIHDNRVLEASGIYGDPEAGEPLEYDDLTIEEASKTTRIWVYNRGIMLFTSHDEIFTRIHRVCSAIERESRQGVPAAGIGEAR